MSDAPPDNGGVADDEAETMARRLTSRDEPFVRATVVRREPPVSANVGDCAVITADGEIYGWIGGVECAQAAVIEQAREAIEIGEARLVGLAPDPATVERSGLVALPMTCHGDGTIEVFLEPVVPAPELLLIGETAVAAAVGQFASELGFAVTVVGSGGESPPYAATILDADDAATIADAFTDPPFAVVASMGDADAVGVAAAVGIGAPYVGLVASDRRATAVVERAAELLDASPSVMMEAVTVPAGIDIDARTPTEIGVSIAAELVRVRSGTAGPAAASLDTEEIADGHATARDPVCGMAVDIRSATPTVEHNGETFYFCSADCAAAFGSAPEEYLADA